MAQYATFAETLLTEIRDNIDIMRGQVPYSTPGWLFVVQGMIKLALEIKEKVEKCQ